MDGVVTAEAEQRESIAAGSSPSSSSSFVPRPMEGLHEMAAPPFLTKTYEIVEDPSTDSMVSWSKGRNSFIVWDSHKFSSTLLPKYFKHSNFCSFIRQLNTYGFRKVDPDRWEFANEGFLCGQKHLLKNIKRRRHAPQAFQQQSSRDCADLGQCGLESELERLKRDRKLLRSEIVKLQEQQLNSRDQIIAMEGRLRSTERKQQQMMAFLAKALSNRSFVRQLLAANPPTRGARRIEVGRKRSLPSSRSVESLREVELVALSEGEVEEGEESQGGAGGIETELKTLLSDALVDVPSAEAAPETSGGGLGCFSDSIWEELWSENVAGRQQELGNLSDIDVEIEDLAGMASPTEPGEGFLNLFDQMGYPRSSP